MFLDLDPDSEDQSVTGEPSEPPSPAGQISELIQQVNVARDPDSDLYGEDYYIVEDDNESASFAYVLCVITQMIKYIQKMKRMVWLGLRKILVPQIYIDLRDPLKLLGFQ